MPALGWRAVQCSTPGMTSWANSGITGLLHPVVRRVHVGVARRRLAGVEPGVPCVGALLRGAVVPGVAREVADCQRGVQRLLLVAALELARVGSALRPGAGVAVGLQLKRHRRELVPVALVEAELALDLVAVLVGDDERDREVAGRAPIALRAAGERLVQRAV